MHTIDMSATLAARLDAFDKSDNTDWRVLEEPQTREISFRGSSLNLLGVGSKIARPFVEQCLENTEVRLLIDNGLRGSRYLGHPVKGDEAYAQATLRPGEIDVICCGGVGGMAYFDELTARANRTPLHLFQAMRRLDLAEHFSDEMWLEYADPRRHVEAATNRDLGPVFADEYSRRTYYALLLYRLSWSSHWLRSVRRPFEEMYFRSGLFALGPSERLVDGGAYTGDSIVDFLTATGGSFDTIDAFEPDERNFSALAASFMPTNRVRLHRFGLWSNSSRLGFSHDGRAGSAISLDNEQSIDVIALDELDIAPTFIKLDVEGAELAALQGACRTIGKHRPALAISVYHRVSHLWDVVAFLEELDLGYRFGLRHYSDYLFDTILYAYPR